MPCHLHFPGWPSARVLLFHCALVAIFITLSSHSVADDKSKGIPKDITKANLDRLMAQWEKDARDKLSKDPAMKRIIQKYPLVILHSRRYSSILLDGRYGDSAYSFAHETSNENIHGNNVQILFDNGAADQSFSLNCTTGNQNLLADLGKVEFTKDPDVKKIDLDGDGLNSWDPKNCKAVEDHVYVERVRDEDGNNFYVVFRVVALDKDSRYVAFVWRRLPGGIVIRRE